MGGNKGGPHGPDCECGLDVEALLRNIKDDKGEVPDVVGKLLLATLRLKMQSEQHQNVGTAMMQRATKAKAAGDETKYKAFREMAIEEFTAMIDAMIDGGAEIIGMKMSDDEEKPSGTVFN